MLLSESDIQDLTGYTRPSAQVRWLRHNGWKFTLNAHSKPVVALAEFNRHLVQASYSAELANGLLRSEPVLQP